MRRRSTNTEMRNAAERLLVAWVLEQEREHARLRGQLRSEPDPELELLVLATRAVIEERDDLRDAAAKLDDLAGALSVALSEALLPVLNPQVAEAEAGDLLPPLTVEEFVKRVAESWDRLAPKGIAPEVHEALRGSVGWDAVVRAMGSQVIGVAPEPNV